MFEEDDHKTTRSASDARLRAMRQALAIAWRDDDEPGYREIIALAGRGLSEEDWTRFAMIELRPLPPTPESR